MCIFISLVVGSRYKFKCWVTCGRMLSTREPKVFNCLVTVVCSESAFEYCKCITSLKKKTEYHGTLSWNPNRCMYDTQNQDSAFPQHAHQNYRIVLFWLSRNMEHMLMSDSNKWLNSCCGQYLTNGANQNYRITELCFSKSSRKFPFFPVLLWAVISCNGSEDSLNWTTSKSHLLVLMSQSLHQIC